MADILKYGNAIRLAQLASDPSGAENGVLYYNTTDGVVKQFVSGGWQEIPDQALTLLGLTLNDGEILVGNASNVSAAVDTDTVGDVQADHASGLVIKSGVIVNGQISASAAIDLSKLAALTASRALVSDGSGVISASSVTSTELGHVSGVTSAIQTQLNDKASATDLSNHISDASDAHDASAISNVPSGNLAATDVQAALDELQSDIDTRALDSAVIKKNGSVAFTADQSMGGNKLTNLAAPTAASDAATKGYVDNALEGLRPKEAVRVATTANISLATDLEAGDSIDGVTLVAGDRVLVKNQSTASQNGIYVAVASGAASRSADFDSLSPVDEVNKAYVAVQEGTANAGKLFVQYGAVATLGTDPINFTFFNSVSGLTGGDGIDVSGSNIAVDHDGQGLQFVTGQLALELDGSTLSKGTSGVKVATGGITNTEVNASAAIDATKIGNGDVDNTELSHLNGVTSAIQTQIDGKQPLDATLTALAAFNTNGLLTQTAADTFAGRTLTAGSGVAVTDGNGVAGNPTVAVDINGTTAETSADNADKILIHDNSAGALRSMTRSNFLSGIALTSPGDIAETTWSGLANNTANQVVTGLSFNNATVRSFKAQVSVVVDATSDQFAVFELMGIQRGSDWQMSEVFTGDSVTGLTFDITSAGQVRVTIGNITGFSSGTVKFRALTTGV